MSSLLTLGLILAALTSGVLAFWVKLPAVLAAVTCLWFVHRKQGMSAIKGPDWILLAFVIYCLASISWASEPFYAATAYVPFMLLPCFYLVARLAPLSVIENAVIAGAVLFAAVAVGLSVSGFAEPFRPWLNVNQFCAFLNMACAFLLVRAFQTERPVWWLVVLLIQAAIALTFSRSGLVMHVALIALVVGGLWMCGHRPRLAWGLVAVVSMIGLAAIASAMQEGLIVKQITDSGVDIRALIWHTSIQAWHGTPVSGVGIGNFVTAYAPLQQIGDPTAGLSAHNDILHIMVELGVIGAVMAVVLFAASLLPVLTAFMRRTVPLAVLAPILACVVYAGHGLITTLWGHPALYAVLGLSLGALVIREGGVPYALPIRPMMGAVMAIWVLYTASLTLGGLQTRAAIQAMQTGDLAAMIDHLNIANWFYTPDDPKVEGMLNDIQKALKTLH